jgi:hypothetical protein
MDDAEWDRERVEGALTGGSETSEPEPEPDPEPEPEPEPVPVAGE